MPDLFTNQNESQGRDRRLGTDAPPVQQTPMPQPSTQSPISPVEPPASTDEKSSRFTQASAKLQNIKGKISNVHNMRLFDAYTENPAKVYFENQEADEHVLLFLRKSQFLNIPWVLATVAFIIIPPILYLFRDTFLNLLPPTNFILLLIPFYYLGVLTYAFVNFITWYYNAALITNKRVVDIDFHQLLMKEVNETKLALVQDVSYRQDGVFENMFDFGYVLVQTAGTIDNFEFWGLPRPDRIVQIVQNLIGGKRFYEP